MHQGNRSPLTGWIRFSVLAVASVLSSSCVTQIYDRTSVGRLEGDLEVRWLTNDCFLYIPSEKNPLRFTRDGATEPLQPRRRFYTDGGSIPRVLWSMPQFSPWGYAPGYLIHDWLFEAHRCDEKQDRVTFEESATILAEVIKTQMERNSLVRDKVAHGLIYAAVGSPIARRLWETPRACDIPPAARTALYSEEVLQRAPVIFRVRDGKAVAADGPLMQNNTGLAPMSESAAIGLKSLTTVCGSSH